VRVLVDFAHQDLLRAGDRQTGDLGTQIVAGAIAVLLDLGVCAGLDPLGFLAGASNFSLGAGDEFFGPQ